jgi:hypothetical protein
MTQDTTGSDALFAALDEGAIKMLQLLNPEAVDTTEDEPIPVDAATKVKIFEAVVDYAALRAKAEPPKKLQESKFDAIRKRFHGEGDEAPRRNRSRKAQSEQDQ